MPIAWLLPLIARAGVPERFQKLAAYAALILGIIVLCGLVAAAWALIVHRHDKQVIQNHDTVQAAQVTSAELTAERTAEANDAVRQQTRAAETQDLNAARDEAIRSHPDETAKQAGPATAAALDRLRRQAAGHQHAVP